MAYKPQGLQDVIPHLVVNDGGAALDHYANALGAEITHRMDIPGTTKIMHAGFRLGDCMIFLADANPDMNMPAPAEGSGARFYAYVADVDAVHKSALAHGMTELHAPQDMFWGDRTSVLKDKYGYFWTLATKVRDVAPEDMQAAMQEFAGQS